MIWETWLNKQPTTIDKRYDIHRTIDSDYQGVMILTKKNLAIKAYINEEPYIITVEIAYNETIFIIEVCMKEELKVEILEQLKNLLNRIRRKHKNPNIILYWDLNTNKSWPIEYIEKSINLKWSVENKSLITRKQKLKELTKKSTLDYFLTTRKTTNLFTIEQGKSDHLLLVAKIETKHIKWKKQKEYLYYSKSTVNENNIALLLKSKWPEENQQNVKKIIYQQIQDKTSNKDSE